MILLLSIADVSKVAVDRAMTANLKAGWDEMIADKVDRWRVSVAEPSLPQC